MSRDNVVAVFAATAGLHGLSEDVDDFSGLTSPCLLTDALMDASAMGGEAALAVEAVGAEDVLQSDAQLSLSTIFNTSMPGTTAVASPGRPLPFEGAGGQSLKGKSVLYQYMPGAASHLQAVASGADELGQDAGPFEGDWDPFQIIEHDYVAVAPLAPRTVQPLRVVNRKIHKGKSKFGKSYPCDQHHHYAGSNAFYISEGSKFTYTNRRKGQEETKCRLDRVLVSDDWRNLYINAYVVHMTSFHSDHNPIKLCLNDASTGRSSPFRFESMWSRDTRFRDLVSDHWQNGGSSGNLLHKLESLKGPIKTWNRKIFGNVKEKGIDHRFVGKAYIRPWSCFRLDVKDEVQENGFGQLLIQAITV
ncbi:hypothetical protein QQ045_017319 [Rhodiola kirilowii]